MIISCLYSRFIFVPSHVHKGPVDYYCKQSQLHDLWHVLKSIREGRLQDLNDITFSSISSLSYYIAISRHVRYYISFIFKVNIIWKRTQQNRALLCFHLCFHCSHFEGRRILPCKYKFNGSVKHPVNSRRLNIVGQIVLQSISWL